MKKSLVVLTSLVLVISLLLIACGAPAPAPAPAGAAGATGETGAAGTSGATGATGPAGPAATPAPVFESISLTMSGTNSQSDPASIQLQWWMDEVTKRTGGAVTFRAFWGASLFPPKAHLAALEKGAIDVMGATPNFWASDFPMTNINFPWPGNPQDPRILVKGMRQMFNDFPQLGESLAEHNLQFLAYGPFTNYRIMMNEPLSTIEEFKGKKIGVVGRFFGMWLAEAGMVPVTSTGSERYTSMQAGLIDLDLMPMQHQFSTKLYEISKYYSSIPVPGWALLILSINKSKFDSFSPELQKIMLEAAEDSEDFAIDFITGYVESADEVMKGAGIQTIQFDEEDLENWLKNLPDLPAIAAQELEDKGLPGFAWGKRWQEVTTELGHTWTRQWAVKP